MILMIIKYNQQLVLQNGITIAILFLSQKQKTLHHLLNTLMLKKTDIERLQQSIGLFQYL